MPRGALAVEGRPAAAKRQPTHVLRRTALRPGHATSRWPGAPIAWPSATSPQDRHDLSCRRFRGRYPSLPMTTQRSTATIRRDRWSRMLIIWPFLATFAVLLLLGNASLDVLAGLRAFVSAESHWSKARSAAVSHLEQYAQTWNEDSWRRYLAEMSVTEGLRAARIELDKPDADFDVARRAFRDARNHPDDIESMIVLFRRFRNVGFMATTVAIWAQADCARRRTGCGGPGIARGDRSGQDARRRPPAAVASGAGDRPAAEAAGGGLFGDTGRGIAADQRAARADQLRGRPSH